MKPELGMGMGIKLFPGLFAFFVLISATLLLPSNDPPRVEILKPPYNATFHWDSFLPYEIEVKDKEDGMSKYDEIDSDEVFLKVTLLPDSAGLKSFLRADKSAPDPAGFELARAGKCFTCHAKKSRLLGPSFEAISERYDNNPETLERLTHSVLKGSEGIWGLEKMPPNPRLNATEASEIIQWIIQTGRDKNVDFLPGLKGTFQTAVQPAYSSGKAVYILTASYTDHANEDSGEHPKQGKYSIVLRSLE